jgi:hypothetical protein
MSKKIRRYVKIFLLCLLLVFGAEMTLRLWPQETSLKIVPDAEIGFLGAPRQRQRYRIDATTYVKETDGKGFSNREPWPERVHIVFLGDSLVEGSGVNIDENPGCTRDKGLTTITFACIFFLNDPKQIRKVLYGSNACSTHGCTVWDRR